MAVIDVGFRALIWQATALYALLALGASWALAVRRRAPVQGPAGR